MYSKNITEKNKMMITCINGVVFVLRSVNDFMCVGTVGGGRDVDHAKFWSVLAFCAIGLRPNRRFLPKNH